MFATMGALLTGNGLPGDRAMDARSLGSNINRVWRVALIAAASCMLTFPARRRGAGR
jgi:hypothetical protein